MNKEPLRLSDSETLKQLKSLPGDIKSARSELAEMVGSASDLYDRIKGITSEIKNQVGPMTGVRKAFRSITADANKLRNDELEIERLNSKQLKNLQERVKKNAKLIERKGEEIKAGKDLTKFAKEEVDQISDLANEFGGVNKLTAIQRDQLLDLIQSTDHLSNEQKAILSSYYDQDSVLNDILGKTQQRLDAEIEIDKKVRGFTAAADLVSAIPGLRQFAGPFKEAEKAAREVAETSDDSMEILKAGGEGLLKSFGPITVAVTGIAFLTKIFFEASKQLTELGKSMAVSREEAEAFRSELYSSSALSSDLVMTTERLAAAQGELAKSAGATRGFRMDELKAQTRLVGRMGVQAETAGKLANLSRVNGENAEDGLDAIIGSTQELMRQQGIQFDIRDVTEEVANTSGQIASQYKNNPRLIGQAVVQARRLGLELSKTRDISGSLLDFESSLTNELEAELLIGKQLNLENARALALQGKYVEATAEIVKQVGTIDDFNNLNIIQQDALAKAAGMSSDEMADMLLQQKNLTLLGRETKKQINDRVKALRAEGKTEEANNLLRQSGSDAQAKAAMMRLDAQQKFNLAMEKVSNLFSILGNNLTTVLSIMGALAGVAAAIAVSITIATAGTNVLPALGAMALAGIGGAVGGGLLGSSISSVDKEPDAVAQDFVLKTDKKDSFALVGGTSLASNDSSIKEMASDMKALVNEMKKSTVLNINSNNVVQKAIVTSYK